MQRLNAIDAIVPALRRTRELLREPLSTSRLVLFWLLGMLAFPSIELPTSVEHRFAASSDPLYTYVRTLHFSPIVRDIGITLAVVGAIVAVIAALLTTFRVPFMLFDLVSGRRSSLGELWRKNGDRAWQWFWFSACVGFAFAIATFVAHGIFEVLHLQAGLLHRVLAGVSAVATWSVVWLGTEFVIVIYTLAGGSVTNAVRDVLRIMQADVVGFCGYLALKLGLAVVASFLALLVAYASNLILFQPVEGVAMRVLQAHTSNGMTSFSMALVGAGFAVGLAHLFGLVVYACLTVPTVLFFEALALVFFADRYAELAEILAQPGYRFWSAGIPGRSSIQGEF